MVTDQYLSLDRFSGPAFIRDWEDQLAELRRIRAVTSVDDITSSSDVPVVENILPLDLIAPPSSEPSVNHCEPTSSTSATNCESVVASGSAEFSTINFGDLDLSFLDTEFLAADFQALFEDIADDPNPPEFEKFLAEVSADIDQQPTSSSEL